MLYGNDEDNEEDPKVEVENNNEINRLQEQIVMSSLQSMMIVQILLLLLQPTTTIIRDVHQDRIVQVKTSFKFEFLVARYKYSKLR